MNHIIIIAWVLFLTACLLLLVAGGIVLGIEPRNKRNMRKRTINSQPSTIHQIQEGK